MAHATAHIETLGTKHRNYNNQLKNAMSDSDTLNSLELGTEMDDLDNLMKIDIAGRKNDFDYILKVLKGEDMLYVSRALQQSPWLADDQYADTMNPENLQNKLLPNMTTRAGIKLKKHLCQLIKNEQRAEEFYNKETDRKLALKWLARCSVQFMEKEIKEKKPTLTTLQFQRFSEKSITIFQTVIEYVDYYKRDDFLSATMFLLKTHTNIYLDAVERNTPSFGELNLKDKGTKLVMTKCPERIMEKPEKYLKIVHLPTFVKYLKPEEIKSFLYKMANNNNFYKHYRVYLFRYEKIKYFIQRLPQDEQFDFVKKLFIDKSLQDIDESTLTAGTEIHACKRISNAMIVYERIPIYVWYKFAPFDTAFTEIKKLIAGEESSEVKHNMFHELISMAERKNENLILLFAYYNKSSLKDDKSKQAQIIQVSLAQTDIHKYDDDTWNEFSKILSNVPLTDGKCEYYNKAMIIYNLINNKPVPENITNNFAFDTYADYKTKLTKYERELIFNFLYNLLTNKIQNYNIIDEKSFAEAVQLVVDLLDLLKDWDKNIIDYPIALEKIKYLIKIKNENSYKYSLAHLYNKNKKWRVHMFEDSIALCPTQDVCVNALKHDPSLLSRHENEIEALCANDKVSLKQLLRKLRVYWSQTLAKDWTKTYLERINKQETHEALIKGIFTLVPQEQAIEIINKYAPENPKIDWMNTNGTLLSVQRSIAKNMHITRPKPTPESVLLYAKGDYLQYALPSVLAIYYNLSPDTSQNHVLNLLNVPVSLQKHGLRFAFQKLEHNILKEKLSNIWNNSKNATIKIIIFEHTFDRLTKEKDERKAMDLWGLMSVFISNLTFKENNKIYDLLKDINKIDQMSLRVRRMFIVRTYKFLNDLYNNTKDEQYKYHLETLASYTRTVVEYLPPTFIEKLIKEFLEQKYYKYGGPYVTNVDSQSGMLLVTTAYVLCAKTDMQEYRFNKILVPLIRESLYRWNDSSNGKYFIRSHLQHLLTRLFVDLNYFVFEKKVMIPVKIYRCIWDELQELDVSENYYTVTFWNLTVKMTELIEESEKKEENKSANWDELCSKILPQMSEYMVEVLKKDVKNHFPSIYLLYSKVMDEILSLFALTPEDPYESFVLQILERFLIDPDFIEGYLTAIKLFPHGYNDDKTKKYGMKLHKMILEHPSVAIKMHYYNVFNENVWTIDA